MESTKKTTDKKRKRGEAPKKVSDAAEPLQKKNKSGAAPVAAEEEPRTFATTQEWLESEQWSEAIVGEEGDGCPDLHALATSPDVVLWLIKAPAQFDSAALLEKELHVEDFTELQPGQAASCFTLATDDKRYSVHAADPGEYRQLIDLFPSAEERRLLLGKPFARGFNITEAVESKTASAVPVRARPVVPQPSNLRLRFRPPGYVMTKKEQKLEEKMAKKHKKAVTMAKRTTPPLRSVPITKSTSVGVVAEGTQLDEDVMEEAEEEAEEEEEIPLERKKEKIKKASGKTSSAATPTKTKDKKTKKTKKMEKGGKKHKGDKKKQ